MEIEILKDIRDSSGEVIYRAGQKDVHVPTSVGEHYIFLKEARRPVYKSAAEWIAAQERERQAALPADKKVQIVQWGMRRSFSNDTSAPHYILTKTAGAETSHYTAPPAGCPADVVARWNKMLAQDIADWKERQAFLKRQASESSTSGYNIVDVAKVLVIGDGGVK